jgi:hypothetical protein
MEKVVLLIKSIGMLKEKIDLKNIIVGELQMEIVMTDKPTIQWCADNFGGKVYDKPRKEHKMQYRWRRSFREACEIAKAIYLTLLQKKISYNKL